MKQGIITYCGYAKERDCIMKRVFAMLIILGLTAIPLNALAEEDAQSGTNLVYNGDFSQFSEAAYLPEGWDFDVYVNDGYASQADMEWNEEEGYCVSIRSAELNDARICQEVAVEPDTVYRLGGYVRTEGVRGDRGATLGVDNYSMDGSYCYSLDVVDTTEWTEVELFFRTGHDQDTVNIALRLGGYGTMALGDAWFSDVSLSVWDASDSAVVIVNLPTENGAGGTAQAPDKAETPSGAMFTAMLLGCAAGFTLFLLLYWFEMRSESGRLMGRHKPKTVLWIILAAAFILRTACSVIFVGHSTDINCFMAWGNAVNSLGMSNFYTSGMFADYPPGYMYLCGLLSAIGNALGLGYGSAGYVFLFKLPATLSDMALAYMLWRLAEKKGVPSRFCLLLAGLVALNPALAFVSGGWGQIDSLLTLLIIGSMLLLMSQKRVLSGALYGLAILIKPQALMFGPLLAVAFLFFLTDKQGRKQWKKLLLDTILAVAAAVAVIAGMRGNFQVMLQISGHVLAS